MGIIKICLAILLFFVLGIFNLNAQDIKVSLKTEKKVIFSLNNIRNLVISADNIIVNKTNSTNEIFNINDVTSFSFETFSNVLFQNNIVICPNPVHNFLSFYLLFSCSDNLNLQILDMAGRIVHKVPFSVNQDKMPNILDISFLSNGLYLLTLRSKTCFFTCKFIKQ